MAIIQEPTKGYESTLVHTYSSDGYRIKQVETGNVYDSADDVIGSTYTYTETSDKVERTDLAPVYTAGEGINISEDNVITATSRNHMTVTCIADDGTTVAGQAVTVRNADTGKTIKAFTYNGQPVTFEIPALTNYKVTVVCTLTDHYCEDVVTGQALGDPISVVLTFKSLGTVDSFPKLKSLCNQGLADKVQIGTQVSFTHDTYGELIYDVVDYDDESDTLTLLQHTALKDDRQFDAPEASWYCSAALAKGSYKMTLGSTAYYFTLSKEAPLGAQIRVTSGGFSVYKDAYATDAYDSGSVSTTEVSGATNLGTTGIGNVNHYDRVQYGSNTYAESALGRWVNSAESGGSWWTPATQFDRPPSYTGTSGFLAGVPAGVLECVDETDVMCYAYPGYHAPESEYEGGRYTLKQRFFLAGEKEIFGSASYDDGTTQFDRYVGTGNSDKIKYYGTSARSWWLRSPHTTADSVHYVGSSGADYNTSAYSSCGVVPACKISKSS